MAERYNIPDEDGAPSKAAGAASKMAQHGWSNARAHSATMLASNPNAYFYRHVAPHEEQVPQHPIACGPNFLQGTLTQFAC